MISEYNNKYLQECITFTNNLNQGINTVRYFPATETEIRKHIEKIDKSVTHKQLLYLENDKITGYMEVIVSADESYIQITALFCENDFNRIGQVYFNYLKKVYPEFKLHYVISDKNTNSIDLMNSIESEDDGIETMIHVLKEDFVKIDHENVVEMQESYYKDFIEVHDRIYPDAYWTGKLILGPKTKFKRFMLLEDNVFVGYSILSSTGYAEEEIYFVYANSISNRMKLISKSLEVSFSDATSVLLLLEEHELQDINQYKKLGFKEKEKTITYTVYL